MFVVIQELPNFEVHKPVTSDGSVLLTRYIVCETEGWETRIV